MMYSRMTDQVQASAYHTWHTAHTVHTVTQYSQLPEGHTVQSASRRSHSTVSFQKVTQYSQLPEGRSTVSFQKVTQYSQRPGHTIQSASRRSHCTVSSQLPNRADLNCEVQRGSGSRQRVEPSGFWRRHREELFLGSLSSHCCSNSYCYNYVLLLTALLTLFVLLIILLLLLLLYERLRQLCAGKFIHAGRQASCYSLRVYWHA